MKNYVAYRLKNARSYANRAAAAARKGDCGHTYELIGGAWFNYGAAVSDTSNRIEAGRRQGHNRQSLYNRTDPTRDLILATEKRLVQLCRCAPSRSAGLSGVSRKRKRSRR